MQSQKQHQAHLLPRRSLYAFRLPVAARTHALMLSSATEITLTASTASATIADAILRQSVPLGEAVIAVALFFWLAAEIACIVGSLEERHGLRLTPAESLPTIYFEA